MGKSKKIATVTEDKAFLQRLHDLDACKAEVFLPADIVKKVRALIDAAHRHYDEANPHILLVPQPRIAMLHKMLAVHRGDRNGAHILLSELDMIELQQVSRYAERYHEDFGKLGMKPTEIAALTGKLEKYTKAAFHE